MNIIHAQAITELNIKSAGTYHLPYQQHWPLWDGGAGRSSGLNRQLACGPLTSHQHRWSEKKSLPVLGKNSQSGSSSQDDYCVQCGNFFETQITRVAKWLRSLAQNRKGKGSIPIKRIIGIRQEVHAEDGRATILHQSLLTKSAFQRQTYGGSGTNLPHEQRKNNAKKLSYNRTYLERNFCTRLILHPEQTLKI